jgi:ElaB/YqjD/DUF883 family membrane-anchored ribosome-binding protein
MISAPARAQAELEAQWAREAAKKQSQARTAALDAKIERMEAEEERRYQQARTPASPAFDMAKWKQQEYAPPSTSHPGTPTSGTHNFSRKPKPAPAQPVQPGLWNTIKTGVTNLWNKLTLPFQKPAAPVTPTHAFPRNPKPAEPGLWNRFTSAVTSTVKKFVTPVVNVVKKVVTPVVNTVKEVVAPLVPVWNAVKTKLSDTWNAIKANAIALWNTTRTKLQNGWNALQSWAHNANQAIRGFFREHPVIAWGTAGALTIGTAIGARNLYCYGSLLPPVSSLDLAGWVALPLAGLLTTDRKHRLHGLFVGLVLGGMIFSACAPRPGTPTPTISICPEPPTRTPKPTQTPNPPTNTPLPTWMSRAYQFSNKCPTRPGPGLGVQRLHYGHRECNGSLADE